MCGGKLSPAGAAFRGGRRIAAKITSKTEKTRRAHIPRSIPPKLPRQRWAEYRIHVHAGKWYQLRVMSMFISMVMSMVMSWSDTNCVSCQCSYREVIPTAWYSVSGINSKCVIACVKPCSCRNRCRMRYYLLELIHNLTIVISCEIRSTPRHGIFASSQGSRASAQVNFDTVV